MNISNITDFKNKYKIILADPPWSYNNYGMKKHGAAKAHYQGITKEQIAAIPVKEWISPEGAVLFLWSTSPKELDGEHLFVARTWGFKLVTKAFCWAKCNWKCDYCNHGWNDHYPTLHDNVMREYCHVCVNSYVVGESDLKCQRFVPKPYFGTGSYTGGGSESVWLGVAGGGWSKRRASKAVRELLIAPQPRYPNSGRAKHSAKPEVIQDRIEELYDASPRLELFATRERRGWDCFGFSLGHWISERGIEEIDTSIKCPSDQIYLKTEHTPMKEE